MKTVEITIKGAIDMLTASLDGAELTFEDGVAKVEVASGTHTLYWEVKGQNGNKFNVKIAWKGTDPVEFKRDIKKLHSAVGDVSFEVKEDK